jgi:hypothetical protein
MPDKQSLTHRGPVNFKSRTALSSVLPAECGNLCDNTTLLTTSHEGACRRRTRTIHEQFAPKHSTNLQLSNRKPFDFRILVGAVGIEIASLTSKSHRTKALPAIRQSNW